MLQVIFLAVVMAVLPFLAVATPAKVKCLACGKTLKTGTHGKLCAQRIAKGHTQQAQALAKVALAVASPPKGFIKVAQLHKYIKANPTSGATVGGMVRHFGGDTPIGALYPSHPLVQLLYVGKVRYIHGALATPTGLTALATGNFAKVPQKGTKLASTILAQNSAYKAQVAKWQPKPKK
jgi:hypothetical protein